MSTPSESPVHAPQLSDPQLIAELIEAHIAGEPLVTQSGRRSVAAAISVDDNSATSTQNSRRLKFGGLRSSCRVRGLGAAGPGVVSSFDLSAR